MLKVLLIFLNIFLLTNASTFVYANDMKNNTRILSKKNLFPSYILGPGDKLIIKIYKMEDFDVAVKILPDGTINLPRVGPISIVNLSLKEAKNKIQKEYEKILKRPIIYLDIIEFRPISLLITGEVQKPGIYSMGLNRNNNIESATGGKKLVINSMGWPTLIDAIQLAGGVTPRADLKNVLIKSSGLDSGTTTKIPVDGLSLLMRST